MKILAIGAHPDDIEIFMFGFLACCKKRGDDIHLIVATDGSLGGDEKEKKLISIRSQETKSGLAEIGDPILLNLPDSNLGKDYSHKNAIRKQIENINPNLIITHSKNDYHSDHRNLSVIVQEIASHYIPVVFCDTLMGINFNPNYYVDVTPFFVTKEKAILKHKSQNPERFVKLVRLMNSYRSAQCNAPEGHFAEAYSFDLSFPFSDIRQLLPPSPPLRLFHINNVHGFL